MPTAAVVYVLEGSARRRIRVKATSVLGALREARDAKKPGSRVARPGPGKRRRG